MFLLFLRISTQCYLNSIWWLMKIFTAGSLVSIQLDVNVFYNILFFMLKNFAVSRSFVWFLEKTIAIYKHFPWLNLLAELIGSSNRCEKSDAYSFGVILSSLISKNVGQMSSSELRVHQSFVADPDYDDQLGSNMVDLVCCCLNTDLEQRPTLTEIIRSFPTDIKRNAQVKRTKFAF